MKFVLFYHSLVSDWNHGNAHFLRGVVTELIEAGHVVDVYEPSDSWSRQQLVEEHGEEPLAEFARRFPRLRSHTYDVDTFDLDVALDGADVVLVHEWNDPLLVARIGRHRQAVGSYRLLFHDTHHRSVTAPQEMEAYDLGGYDGVLAFGEAVRQRYLERGWAQRVWTWHEAADTRVFKPIDDVPVQGDLVWIGSWGDDERSRGLCEFLVEPVAALSLFACVHGVRYPRAALDLLAEAGIDYRGWLPNHRVPEVFAAFRVTVHVPRRPYVLALPGIPTIRVFEALACGIPLVSAPWHDVEGLFHRGRDYLVARNGTQMRRHLRAVLHDRAMARELRENGLRTVRSRHTCAHRVQELFTFLAEFGDAVHVRNAAGPEQGRSLHA